MIFFRKKAPQGRVLIIEDETEILEILKIMLEDAGHVVVTAENGTAALAAAKGKPFDVVVMDVSMPGMSGIDIARALRAEPNTAGVRIAFHTGLDEHWVRERFADYDLFATKARDVEQFVAGIGRLIAEPKRDAVGASGPGFTSDDVARARQALRGAMGLGPGPLEASDFVDQLGDEIGQLRKLGKDDVAIADMIGSAIGRPVAPSLIASHGETTSRPTRKRA